MDIENAVCIVTGASSGIGAASARRLAQEGATVVLAARRAERLRVLADELPRALAVPTDVTDAAQVRRLVERSVETYGRVDVLVNNAGQGLHVPLVDVDADDLRAVFDLNVVAPLTMMQAVLPAMSGQAGADPKVHRQAEARSGGAIVNISSATSLRVFPGLGAYSATKAALNLISQVARLEFAKQGVSVSVVYPALTATEFHKNLRAGGLASGARSITPDPPELAAEAILHAIRSGAAHVLVGDPPREIESGGDVDWPAMLARQLPR